MSSSTARTDETSAETGIGEPHSGVVDGVDVDAVAAAIDACPGVSGLYSGPLGEIGTYLPGRRVAGVQVASGTLTVSVCIRWGIPVDDVAAQIRGSLAGFLTGSVLDIVIADVDDPPTTCS